MWFRCSGGNGTGDGATITVTYSEEFYGVTLTATNGVKTVTKVAPSTGSVDIDVPEGGSWVISATVGGETYSSKPVVVELEYATVIETIPNGSTVLPTDDIQTWLKCAGITDKTTYTTLSDVLGDTDTLIALCADSNACDYMARSTTWASGVAADSTAMLIVGKYNYCANALMASSAWLSAIIASSYADYVMTYERGLVPVMTSNTTPSGQCFGSGNYNSDFYYAFNNLTAMPLGWASQDNSYEKYVGYKFTQSTLVSAIKLWSPPNANNNEIKTFKVQYKNSQNAWIDATGVLTYLTATQSNAFSKAYIFDTPVQTEEIRILALSNIASNNIIRVCLAQFYSLEYPTSSQLITIHSAANDTIYYLDGSTHVTVAVTDANGKAVIDTEDLDPGTYTLYSTVAKNPDNLSNPYTKSIKINGNTTEIYLMPILSLYWWGYENGIEISDHSIISSASNAGTITRNTNNIACYCRANVYYALLISKHLFDMNELSKLCMVGMSTYDPGNHGETVIGLADTSGIGIDNCWAGVGQTTPINTMGLAECDVSQQTIKGYPWFGRDYYQGTSTIYSVFLKGVS